MTPPRPESFGQRERLLKKHRSAGTARPRGGTMKKHIAALGSVCACIAAAAFVPRAHATEGGSQEYPLGVNSSLPALLPPPGGTELLNYLQYYAAGRLAGPNGDRVVPGFHVNVTAEVVRVLHTWPVQLGPFTFTSGIVQPTVNIDAHLPFTSKSQDRLGLGDTVLQPLYVSYDNPAHTFFSYFGSNIWVPDGEYNVNHAVNTGLNRWSFGPEAAVTWFPNKRLQLSLQSIMEFNTQNNATKYKGGDAISFDYGVDYMPLERFNHFFAGIGGYAYQQFTDDTVNGRVFRNGNRGRTIAIGPQFRYNWERGGIIFKWQKEFAVQNRSVGDRFWIQFAVPIF